MRALKITKSITSRDEKSLEKYFNEISKYDVLTPEEELRLFQEYKSGSEHALTRLVFHNLRFVVSVAKKYQHIGLPLGDLINEGNIGLIKAAQRFDETKGFKFISYAVWWIRQSILQSINDKSKKVRTPLSMNAVSSKVQAEITKFMQYNERTPSIEELSEATGIKEESIRRSMSSYQKCKSLDAPISSDSETSLTEVMIDESSNQPDHDLVVKETQQREVKHLLGMLSERQAQVISMFYGIDHKRPHTLESIAEEIGLTRERVRQIRDRGLDKLRKRSKNFIPTFSEN